MTACNRPANRGCVEADFRASAIQANIEKLVSFGTRLTLSAQDPASIAAGHGIGAAREWIKSEFERYSKDCGGCLEVKTDASPKRRPTGFQPTEITNVYAVLKGTDPESAKRIVLVTGHYDSRNSDTLDVKGDAPGANDDASGTAVSLECARVLSKLKFPATIIFLTVAGEEQGLNGSQHFAKMAKEQGWDLEAVLNNDIVGGNKSAEQDHSVVRVFSEGVPVAADGAGIAADSRAGRRERFGFAASGAIHRRSGPGLRRRVKPMLVFRLDRYLRGGDHYSFNQQGFPAVRFTEFREDFQSSASERADENGVEYGDLPKFVDFDYVAQWRG